MAEDPRAEAFDGVADDRTPAKHVTQEHENQELVGRLQELFRQAYEHRHPYASDWEFFRAYLKGDQLVIRHRETGDLIRLTARDQRKLRSVNNYMRPSSRSLVGKLTRSIPTARVTPATTDMEEYHAARTANAAIEYYRHKLDLDQLYQDATEYLPWAGNGWIYLTWDPKGGLEVSECPKCEFYHDDESMVGQECPRCTMQREQELMQHQMQMEEWEAMQFSQIMPHLPPDALPSPDMLPMDQAPQPQQMGPLSLEEPVPTLLAAKSGDICAKVIDVSDVFVQPGIEKLSEATHFFLRIAMPTVTARQMYLEAAEWITDDDDTYTDAGAETHDRFFDMYTQYEPEADFCRVYIYHEFPTSQYPEGRIIHMINDKIARVENSNPLYKLFGRFPLFHFGFDYNPGEVYREPPMSQAWHRQKEMNENETAIREHIVLNLKPKMFNPIGSGVTADELSATTAQVISYHRAAGKPEFDPPPRVPPDIFNRGEILKNDIRTHFGITEHEVGISPADPNGRAMAILEAEADQMLGPIIRRNNGEFMELYRCILLMIQAYIPEDRLFTLAGP
ncbi:MAG: hypothetical protein NWE76_05675, partial [Candidatus Bathyarchaeota archaeon]|nr:hypothetical protein [Candidatus Bathyarchaeota archaeon]